MADNWSMMFHKLRAFVKRHGHARVPARFSEDPALGRWVAAQRHLAKVNRLSPEKRGRLESLGFTWSAIETSWADMLQVLRDFKAREGHCRVPEKWTENQRLANWVHCQRNRNRNGKLDETRRRELDALGFVWAVYKTDHAQPRRATPGARDAVGRAERSPVPAKVHEPGKPASGRKAAPRPAPAPVHAATKLPEDSPAIERLYCFSGIYRQSSDRDIRQHLEAYRRANGNEDPPYIPLPARPTVFHLGEHLPRPQRHTWSGKGPLPTPVFEYLSENGHLPRHD